MSALFFIFVCISGALASNFPFGRPSGRIIGGQNATEGQFPFAISFRYPTPDWHYCGGSIISPHWVITAGHCCQDLKPEEILIVAGTNKLLSGGQNFTVAEIHVHPEFVLNFTDLANDICLLKLNEGAVESDLLQFATLSKNDEDVAMDAVVIGWGVTEFWGESPDNLQYLKTVTIPHQQCLDDWGGELEFYYPIRENQVCAETKMDYGACNGDSGSPLIIGGEVDPKIVGLVSWGFPCAIGYPDVYTRVSSFASWIESLVIEEI